jgi:hypothetical protein
MGIETSGSIKQRNVLSILSDYKLFKKSAQYNSWEIISYIRFVPLKIFKEDGMISLRMGYVGHVESMKEKMTAYRVLVGKPERKRQLGSPRHILKNGCKMDLGDIG